MLLVIIPLFIAGVFAILLEAILPFGIIVVVGLGLIGLSSYLAIKEFGAGRGSLYMIAAFALAGLAARYAFKLSHRFLALKAPVKSEDPNAARGNLKAETAEPILGASAKVVQPLRPTGTIEWQGRRLPARTVRPETITPAGADVFIRGRDSSFWLVEERSGRK